MEFFQTNQLYVVLSIALIIWLGLFVYLFSMDRKISKLEKQNKL
jgi:CcmD family protein